MTKCLNFTGLRVAGFYYDLGANIQPGVVGLGGSVAMTDVKRKPGVDSPLGGRKNTERRNPGSSTR